eukprot:GHRR01017616.1.p5 GENE.GHRR01017616.1~~GHRR01017616.1.p5  ORF type:complete len:108 (+),score=30.45 GHRR01017616.1:1709-2032(+)
MPPEQVAALKDQIAALRAQLTEAEARDMETQMTMMTLESSNSTLQKQLKDIRTQKQQLEMQLLFGEGLHGMGSSSYSDEPHANGDYETAEAGEPEDTATKTRCKMAS